MIDVEMSCKLTSKQGDNCQREIKCKHPVYPVSVMDNFGRCQSTWLGNRHTTAELVLVGYELVVGWSGEDEK